MTERRKRSRRATDATPALTKGRDVVLIAGFFLALGGIVAAITFGVRANGTASRVGRLTDQIATANFEQCQRGNTTRLTTIGNLRSDIAAFRSDVQFGRVILSLPMLPPPLIDRTRGYIAEHRHAIDNKQTTIRETIAAQAPVAAAPGSAFVACGRVFPH